MSRAGAASRSAATWGADSGSPDRLADLFRGFAAEGFSRVSVWLDPSTPEGIEELARALEILDRD